jgi:CHAT domain-containing protein
LGSKALADEVAALRCGLDYGGSWTGDNEQRCFRLLRVTYTEADRYAEKPKLLPFDLARAHALYNALFGDIKDLVKGKQLLIVASGPLSSLPFQVLVTKPPQKAMPSELADYRKAAWLGQSNSIGVLPSAASLKALRQYARTSRASRPYLGVGNPLLDGPEDDPESDYYKELAKKARASESCANLDAPQRTESARRGRALTSFSSLFRGAWAAGAELRRQVPLPETAEEVCAVARQLGEARSMVLLGGFATETRLKELSESGQLADFAIIHFATHGLLSGELLGAAQPGLILTPPTTDDPSALENDDGYFSAAEIATLFLDADWVVLSACNTAGPSGETSEALSGLARAFFYAGTRALLVSHWAVESKAAVKLATRAFAEMAARPSVGRAEALRFAMRELIENGDLADAHPARWAPFVVVGESRR